MSFAALDYLRHILAEVDYNSVPPGTVLNEHALLPCPPVRER